MARWGQPLLPNNSNRIKGNGLSLHQERFRLVLGTISSQKVVLHCDRLPREVMGSQWLQMFKKRVDVTLKDVA